MPNNELGTLIVRVEEEAKQSASSIEQLAISMQKLKKGLPTPSNVKALNSFAESISEIGHANVASAVSNIDKLSNVLGALKKTYVPKKNVDNLKGISSALSTISGGIPADASVKLTSLFEAVSKIGNVKANSSLSKELRSISAAVNSFNISKANAMGKVAEAYDKLFSSTSSSKEQVQFSNTDKETSSVGLSDATISKTEAGAETLKSLSNASSSIPVDRIREVADAVREFDGLKNAKISSTLPKNIEALSIAAETIKAGNLVKLKVLGMVLSGFKSAGNINYNLPITIQALGSSLAYLDNSSFETMKKLSIVLQGFSSTYKINEKMPEQIVSLSQSLQSVTDEDLAKLDKLVSILSKLQGVSLTGLSTAFRQMNGSLQSTAKESGKSSKEMGKLAKLANMVKRVVLMRAIRGAISAVVSGMREGLTNAYHFAKIWNSDLATNMDRMSSAVLKMKNQLGAAALTLLSQLMPAILAVINAATRVFQIVTQAIAYISGSDTYLKAKDYAKEFDKANTSAGKLKRTLLGFDELNVLNGDGGSGSINSNNYGDMFEWASVESDTAGWLNDFLKPFREMLTDPQLKDALNLLKGTFTTLGETDFPAWLGTVLATLTSGTFKDVMYILSDTVGMISALFDGKTDGKFWFDLLGLIASIGGTFSTILATIAEITDSGVLREIASVMEGGVDFWHGASMSENDTIKVNSIREQLKFGKNDNAKNMASNYLGSMDTDVGEFVIFAMQIGLVFLDIKNKVDSAKQSIVDFFSFKNVGDNELKLGVEFISRTDWKALREDAKEQWNKVSQPFVIAFTYLGSAMQSIISGAYQKLKTTWQNYGPVQKGLSIGISILTGGWSTIFQTVWAELSVAWDDFIKKHPLAAKISLSVSATLSNAKSFINTSIIGKINEQLAKSNIPIIKNWKIPTLANGGILDAGSMFIAREAGPELVGSFGNRSAVMNNEQIVDAVSRGVASAMASVMSNNGGQNISLNVDGKNLFDIVVSRNNNQVLRTGSSPLLV